MLRVISANLNGIRSANTKGFFDWMSQQDADFICVQELKAQEADIAPAMKAPGAYQGYFHYAEKKGYSGVGIYTPHKPESVVIGLGVPRSTPKAAISNWSIPSCPWCRSICPRAPAVTTGRRPSITSWSISTATWPR